MNRPKILIVDDVEENLILLTFALKPFDVDVVRATNGLEAEAACSVDEFVLVILDVHMPGRSGIETAEVIRSETRNLRTPIIFLTADTTASDLPRSAYQTGAVDVMYKPLEAARLRAKVQVFLDLYLEQAKVVALMENLEASQAELVSQEKYQAVASLIGSLSHQFNNQLCIAEGHASALMEASDATQAVSLAKISSAISVCTDLLDTMQTFVGINQVDEADARGAIDILRDFSRALEVIVSGNASLHVDIDPELTELTLRVQPLRKILLSVAQFIRGQVKPEGREALEIEVHAVSMTTDLVVNLRCRGLMLDAAVVSVVDDFFGSDNVLAQQQGLELAAAKSMVQELSGVLSIHLEEGVVDLKMQFPLMRIAV
jgi:CheY-like chemotaxis protein